MIHQILIFKIGDQLFAVDIDNVIKVIQSVAIRRLPKSPKIILGVINYHGEIIAVIDTWGRFKLPPRAVIPSDRFLIVQSGKRKFALPVEEILEVEDAGRLSTVTASNISHNLGFVTHLFSFRNEVVYFIDCKKLLTAKEIGSLNKAMPIDGDNG